MNLSISQSESPIGPTPVTAEDLAQMVPDELCATRQLASVSTTETTVEVTTAQGDQVTLNCSSSLTDYTYIRPEGMDVPGLIDGQELSQTLSIEVQGELSQEELDDIAALQKDLTELISSNSETQETSQSTLSGYDTLSGFTFSTQTTKAKESADEMTIVPYPLYNDHNQTQTTGFPESTEQNNATATYLNLIV